jgi:hypothetical protein
MAKNWKDNVTPAWILYIPTSLRVGYNNNLLNVKTKIWAVYRFFQQIYTD